MTRAQLIEAARSPQGAASIRRRLDGIEDYLFIRGDRLSAAQAAERLGVTQRTIVRWRALLRITGTLP